MKLVRYGPPGHERPAVLDLDGTLRSLSDHLADIDPRVLHPQSLEALRTIEPGTVPKVAGSPRIGACVAQVGKGQVMRLGISGFGEQQQRVLAYDGPEACSRPATNSL